MIPAPQTDRRLLGARLLLATAATVLAALFTAHPALRGLEARLQDAITAHTPQQAAPAGVVVVDISEASLAALGPWPWPRPLLAQLSEALRARGARVQVWDLMLPEGAAGDEQLASTLARPDVVLGQVLVTDPTVARPPREGRVHPAPGVVAGDSAAYGGLCSRVQPVTGYLGVAESLRPAAVGHVAATPDADGRLRRLPAVICHEGGAHPQLALAAAERSAPNAVWQLETGTWPWQAPQTLVRGDWRFPLDADGWLRVPYARSHTAWPAVSVEQVLDLTQRIPELEGSIVLIGATALGLADLVNTPFHPVAPGVSVHAELVGAAVPLLLPGGTARPDGQGATRWLIQPQAEAALASTLTLLLGALLALRLWPHAPVRSATALSVAVIGLPLLVSAAARGAGGLMPALPVVLALMLQVGFTWLLNAAWLRRQSLLLARHLQGFMPRALAREIAGRNPTSDSLGHAEHGTLLAIRIQGLERWQDSVPPVQALGLIHGLHATAQSAAALAGGRLEQAQGHTLIAAWPVAESRGAAQALEAARRCLRELQPLLERNESESHPLSMNIAIESGPYLHGVVGHADSRRAILLGPAVADVQGMLELNEDLASPVLFGPEAARMLRQQAPESSFVQRVGTFVLPEQAEPKELFRLPAPALTPAPAAA